MAKAKMRQRVLGAAVILSLGFIGYSILIQSGSSTYIDRSAQIPVQTRYIEPLDFEDPVIPTAEIESDTADQMFLSERQADTEIIPELPTLDDEGKPNAWVIQVGSFSTLDRATEIREQLIEAGYKAYYRKIDSEEAVSVLYRVMVGPYLDATEVGRHMPEIDSLLSLQTQLNDYEP